MKDVYAKNELKTVKDLVPYLIQLGIIRSMSEMKRLIKQGAVKIITYEKT